MTVATKKQAGYTGDIKSGDLMAFTYWATVKENLSGLHGKKLSCVDIDGDKEFIVSGDSLIDDAYSADRYSSVKKVNKTTIVDILINSRNIPFTVVFKKADGSIRRLRGRLIGIDQKNLGYIDVEDLDQPEGKRFRLVDCRTISELIVDDVQYIVQGYIMAVQGPDYCKETADQVISEILLFLK